MHIDYHVIGEDGVHGVTAPLLRRLLQDNAQRPNDRFRVTVDEPALNRVLAAPDMAAFLDAVDGDPDRALRMLAALGVPEDELEWHVQAPPSLPSEADVAPPQTAGEEPPPLPPLSGPETTTASSPPPRAAPARGAGGRPMLVALIGLLALAALLFWPRDGDRRQARPAEEAAVTGESSEPAGAPPPVAPEVLETRFVALETSARQGPDGVSPAVRELTRGERVQIVASGGAGPAPEGWARLQGGGYVTIETLRATAPPALSRRLDREVSLQSEVSVYGGPSLAGPVRRTLARGQRVLIVGLVNDRVAEVRTGMDLGYATYAALVPGEQTTAAAPPSQTSREGQAGAPNQDAASGSADGGSTLVLGANDLTNTPSSNTMARYYPRRALADRVEAQVAIECRVLGSGRLSNCYVWRETRQGYGFGEATVRMAQETFRAPRRTSEGRSTEGAQFRTTVTWRL